MLARRLTTILPAMSLAEALDTIRIHRAAGRTSECSSWVHRSSFPVPPSLAHRPMGAPLSQELHGQTRAMAQITAFHQSAPPALKIS